MTIFVFIGLLVTTIVGLMFTLTWLYFDLRWMGYTGLWLMGFGIVGLAGLLVGF